MMKAREGLSRSEPCGRKLTPVEAEETARKILLGWRKAGLGPPPRELSEV